MKQINLFKLEYDWYEGEHEEIYLGKDVTEEQFEFDLKEAKKYVQSQIGKKTKGWEIDCLPRYYEKIIDYLIEKNYINCSLDEKISYDVNDDFENNISITKLTKEIKKGEL